MSCAAELADLEPQPLAVALGGKSLPLSRLQGRAGTECPSFWTSEDVASKHDSVLRHLGERARAWNSSGTIDAERMGRTASKVENTEKVVSALLEGKFAEASAATCKGGLGTAEGSVVGRSNLQVEHVAKEVDASRISFGPPPAFDAARFLDPETRRVFRAPITCSNYKAGCEVHLHVQCIPDEPFTGNLKAVKEILDVFSGSGKVL